MVAAAPPPPALPPALPPAPVTDPPALFDIWSFLNTFDGKYPGYPDEKLEPTYWTALGNATTRWENFLSYDPVYLSIVKEKYKEKFDKDWNGLELVGIRYGVDNSNQIATASAVSFLGTDIAFGFVMEINNDIMKKGFKDPKSGAVTMLSLTNITNIFAHELGHVIGLCNTTENEESIMLPHEIDPSNPERSYYVPKPKPKDIPNFKCIDNGRFPETYSEHHKLIDSAKQKLGFVVLPYIILSDDGSHWKEDMVTHEIYTWDFTSHSHKLFYKYYYGNFENEIMVPAYNPIYDNKTGYLISSKSLKYLTEIRRGNDLQMFNEKSPGASEVSSVIKTGNLPNKTYILKGKAGIIVPATKGITPVITVERTLSRDADADAIDADADAIDAATDAIDADATDAHAYNVFYPDGYAGDRNDEEEIIQIVKNHERIVNDPAFFKFKCRH